MTAYPAAGDYYKAVQAPARVFTVPKLQAAEFVWDSLGPTLARGSSAVVFQAAVEGKPQALRCYIRNDASSRDRYSALDAYLAAHDLSPYVSGTTWLDGAIQVNRAAWPVLTMDWIDGRTLNEYVDFLVASSNAAALTTLAAKWRALVARLQSSDFAHGDLQHGNIMVDQDGTLRLVDFDGVWIPQLAGQSPPTEFGHPNYQHPLQHVWDRWLDTFSALVIYLSLVALGKDPALWLALYNSKNLLFAKNDFFSPFKTEAWKQLAALGDPQVDELVRRLQECCDPDWVSSKSLEMTLDQQAVTPARQPIPVEQRWWERKPIAAAGAAAEGAPAAGAAARRAGSAARPPGDAVGRPASHPRGRRVVAGPAGVSPVRLSPTRVSPGRASTVRAQPRPGRPRPGAAPSGPALPGAAPSGSAPSAAAATASAQAETAKIATGSLPAPPPLSAPLGLAGTGPMPKLSQTMAPPGATIWWSAPGSASAQPRPVPYGSRPAGSQGSGASRLPGIRASRLPGIRCLHGPVPCPTGQYPTPAAPMPGPSAPAPPATKSQPGPAAGAIALGLGILLLIVGAAGHLTIIVLGGLVVAAWGMWRLVSGTGTGTGGNTKPPGQT